MTEQRLADRRDAGRRLAALLHGRTDWRPVVLGLPRGGVPVGFEIAAALGAPLDLILVRKIGAPGNPELGLGAVADGDPPVTVLNEDLIDDLGVSRAELDAERQRQLREIARQRQAYGRAARLPSLRTCDAIVVDDGIATGGTARAALRAASAAGARRTVLAVPVAPPSTLEALRPEADEIVCLLQPQRFGSVGEHYVRFEQVDDAEVVALLAAALALPATGQASR